MYPTRIATAASALLVALAGCTPRVSDSDLAGRVAASQPQWQSYQEDVKAQLGAGPVAEWAGEAVNARQDSASLALTFRLTGPWALRDPAIPVLVLDPLGHVRQNSATTRQNNLVIYQFKTESAGSASPLPWVEVKFPNGAKRIVFDEKGAWNAT